MDAGSFNDDNNQFVISFELLQLFKWLFEHEQETLKKVMSHAVRHGFSKKLYDATKHKALSGDQLQQTVIDFFALMEALLYEVLHEDEVQRVLERTLIPAINQIDGAACDTATVALSVEKATTFAENHPEQNPKEILCKELLKRWKPAKKNSTN